MKQNKYKDEHNEVVASLKQELQSEQRRVVELTASLDKHKAETMTTTQELQTKLQQAYQRITNDMAVAGHYMTAMKERDDTIVGLRDYPHRYKTACDKIDTLEKENAELKSAVKKSIDYFNKNIPRQAEAIAVMEDGIKEASEKITATFGVHQLLLQQASFWNLDELAPSTKVCRRS
eukprot:GHVQ01003544.1.p1 GENE.GHVQ01003544.1~~GHVQ01003544.1.p1  ORF type:complete len:177 (-),score=34.54 GHVQ01003544.1:195-725(-)